MFKMNPAAKEFVPAHILKKRQEDAERLGELTEKLDKVDINKPDNSGLENGGEKPSGGSEESQESSSTQHSNPRPVLNNRNSTSPNNVSNRDSTSEAQNGKHLNNNHTDGDYPEGLQDLIDEEDDRFLLNAGENICEFNGEQFIIPGDDECEPPLRAGYDFGNVEDNEDEDVCNAFEEFLDNLPGQ